MSADKEQVIKGFKEIFNKYGKGNRTIKEFSADVETYLSSSLEGGLSQQVIDVLKPLYISYHNKYILKVDFMFLKEAETKVCKKLEELLKN